MNVAIPGASNKPERYSHQAVGTLAEKKPCRLAPALTASGLLLFRSDSRTWRCAGACPPFSLVLPPPGR